MEFVTQFYDVLNDKKVKKKVDFLLNQGSRDTHFIDYFGVNYDEENLVSVKLYFSFFDKIPYEALDFLGVEKTSRTIIEQYWQPVRKYEYFHQGLTLALKCYIDNGGIQVNPYFHFRSEKLPYVKPKHIKLSNIDKQNPFGICVEQNNKKTELKHYYYISDPASVKLIGSAFLIDNTLQNEITLLEYTEGDVANKVNIIFNSTEITKQFISSSFKIKELSAYFYQNFQLYYFAPGIRKNSSSKALYFLPKDALNKLCRINTIEKQYNVITY